MTADAPVDWDRMSSKSPSWEFQKPNNVRVQIRYHMQCCNNVLKKQKNYDELRWTGIGGRSGWGEWRGWHTCKAGLLNEAVVTRRSMKMILRARYRRVQHKGTLQHGLGNGEEVGEINGRSKECHSPTQLECNHQENVEVWSKSVTRSQISDLRPG